VPVIEAYVWQSPGRPEVAAAMQKAAGTVATLHVKAAEFRWTGQSFTVERRMDKQLPAAGCGLVVRIGSSASSLDWTADQIAPVAEVIRGLAALSPKEIQCDYDCPQKHLDRYTRLLDALQRAAGPVPVIPTALPSWMDEPAFPKLIARHPGYVLQVHSLQLPKQAGEPVLIFDPQAARAATARASKFGVPFRIAMATYGCEVWFGPDGKVARVISEEAAPDGKAPASRGFSMADPNESARLVGEWNATPPPGLQAVIWYRLPVEGDQRNWPWATFEHVVHGEEQPSDLRLEAIDHEGARDLFIVNRGNFPSPLPARVVIGNETVSSDAVAGYTVEPHHHGHGLRFLRRDGQWPWLDPGKKIPIGWLRTSDPNQRIDWTFTQ